jgi:hypothetical protein
MRKILVILLGIAMWLAGSQAAPTTGNFVSEVVGTEVAGTEVAGTEGSGATAFVAVVTSQDQAIAYICDGEKLAEWFRGPIRAGGLFEARSASRAQITAQINARSVFGVITLEGGRVLPFRVVPANGLAGLYRSDDTIGAQRFLGGWVVLPDGQQRGAVIGGGSTRPGRKLELKSGVVATNLPELAGLKPFQVTAAFLAGQ